MSFEDEDEDNTKRTEKDEFTVYIKTVQGDLDSYTVKASDKIDSLIKRYIEEKKLGVNSTVIFNFSGHSLDRSKTFSEVGINSEDTIHVLVRLKGGMY